MPNDLKTVRDVESDVGIRRLAVHHLLTLLAVEMMVVAKGSPLVADGLVGQADLLEPTAFDETVHASINRCDAKARTRLAGEGMRLGDRQRAIALLECLFNRAFLRRITTLTCHDVPWRAERADDSRSGPLLVPEYPLATTRRLRAAGDDLPP